MVAVFAFALFLTGCDREKEPVPAYLTIEPFELKATDYERHGSISEKITHVDMFMFDSVNNKSIQLGVFELPATFPVLDAGNFSLNIDPVIKANGSSFFLQPYPFYNRFSKPISLSPNADLSVNPNTSYRDDAKFSFIEDFEDNSPLFNVDRDDDTETTIERTSVGAFEGQFSGSVTLDTAHPTIVVQTSDLYDLTLADNGKVFLELDYKTDVPLEFGLVAVEDNGTEGEILFEYVVLEKEDWNKIYFDLTELISTNRSGRFAIILRGGIPIEDGAYTLTQAEILLDNIKLVHF